MDGLSITANEVALEGLDGITLPSLWLRLENRKPKFPLKLDEPTKELLWRSLTSDPDLKFYQNPQERDDIVLFDRWALLWLGSLWFKWFNTWIEFYFFPHTIATVTLRLPWSHMPTKCIFVYFAVVFGRGGEIPVLTFVFYYSDSMTSIQRRALKSSKALMNGLKTSTLSISWKTVMEYRVHVHSSPRGLMSQSTSAPSLSPLYWACRRLWKGWYSWTVLVFLTNTSPIETRTTACV